MSTFLALTISLATLGLDDRPRVVIVVGAPGSPDYDSQFRRWAAPWQSAASKAGADLISIGLDAPGPVPDRDRLKGALAETTEGAEPLWVVMIGHGSHDGKEAKFNLRGPDVSDSEFAGWVAKVRRPVVAIDCASASAPFLGKLSGPDRVVITATRTGSEQNFAHFGEYLAGAIVDPAADLDKDGQVSALEAFLTASNRTAEFYKSKSRLATEHALIDDNGDRLGTPAEFFLGVRATKKAKDGKPADGLRAHQIQLIPSARERSLPAGVRKKRNEIEIAVAALRDQKSLLSEDDYYAKLEPLMLELANLYRDIKPEPGHGH